MYKEFDSSISGSIDGTLGICGFQQKTKAVCEGRKCGDPYRITIYHQILRPGGGTSWTFYWGVPPATPNPDPISDEKIPFPIPVFRPGLKNQYPFSDLTLYVIKHSICISAERKSTLERLIGKIKLE